MIDVEKQIEEVMELVQDLMNAQSSSQRIREKKTLESKLRTLLSSAQSGEQAKSAEAMQAVRNGGCGCCSNACADREDGCRHIHEKPSAADMRPAPALEVGRDAALLERLATWCDSQAASDWYGRKASDMVRAFAASHPNVEAAHG